MALLLAWPTYGISIALFLVFVFWPDNKSIDVVLAATVTAMREEVSEELHGVNESTIQKIFARYAIRPPHVSRLAPGGLAIYWGTIRHPLINAGQVFSVRFSYVPLPGSRGFVNVKAAPGVDESVFTGDDLLNLFESLHLVPAVGHQALANDPEPQRITAVSHEPIPKVPDNVTVDTTKPRSDNDIHNMMIRAAGRPDGYLKCPKLRFAELRKFLNKHNVAMESLPRHGGGRFSIEIGEFSYAASATILNPREKDESGIILWAKIDGYASSRTVAVA
ncbi:hypothetical protein [Massilia sp. BKSP1R2A-1]|uniref:hypothetical protein n=1 Tax=Massilia sp. BKSP1R2A-1 TaxID=3422595 RepID=UPI003D3518D7